MKVYFGEKEDLYWEGLEGDWSVESLERLLEEKYAVKVEVDYA
jgi:hypothetical protein